jgi:hypothetical protein
MSFKNDLTKEEILGRFLDAQYKKLNLKIQRIKQRDLQYRGVDLLMEENGLSYKVDEKAQLSYLNKDLPTFALEIDFIKDNQLKKGWLFDADKVTEMYAFIFGIHLIGKEGRLTKAEDIASCNVIFVNRMKLILELSKLKIDFTFCEQQSDLLRSKAGTTKINHSSGFNFQISNHLPEKPVNLIVRKTFLKKLGRSFEFK